MAALLYFARSSLLKLAALPPSPLENSRAYFSEEKKKEVNILLGQHVKLSSKQVRQQRLRFGVV